MIEKTKHYGSDQRAAVLAELRRIVVCGTAAGQNTLPFGLPALDSHLPQHGLVCGALHEVVPEAAAALPAAIGFIAAIVARLAHSPARYSPRNDFIFFVLPSYGLRPYGRAHGRLHGHGLRHLGLDPVRALLVETANRKDTLWALEQAVRSRAPLAVAGFIDKLDLKLSQRLHLAATDAGLPLILLRPAALSPAGSAGREGWEASAAATRWRIGPVAAARDRFGLLARPRWHLQLERCRNGRTGEWVVEYDHVAHCFSLAATVADTAFACGATEKSFSQAG
jgi:protein ImuA